ncbi:MAG: hypothetical protein Q4C04_02625 [Clostridia bacterium]|nr:hypothetical protein [Clostridia bacterium]
MKKTIIILLAALLVITVVGCKNREQNQNSPAPTVSATEAPAQSPSDEPSADATLEPTSEPVASSSPDSSGEPDAQSALAAELEAIFSAAEPTQMMLAPATNVDLSDADTAAYFLGLSDLTGIREAVYIEPMMSSIAFSAVLIELEDGADVETIKQAIVTDINESKWICVTANKLSANHSGNLIFFVMGDSELVENYMGAFESLHEDELGERFERTIVE